MQGRSKIKACLGHQIALRRPWNHGRPSMTDIISANNLLILKTIRNLGPFSILFEKKSQRNVNFFSQMHNVFFIMHFSFLLPTKKLRCAALNFLAFTQIIFALHLLDLLRYCACVIVGAGILCIMLRVTQFSLKTPTDKLKVI